MLFLRLELSKREEGRRRPRGRDFLSRLPSREEKVNEIISLLFHPTASPPAAPPASIFTSAEQADTKHLKASNAKNVCMYVVGVVKKRA